MRSPPAPLLTLIVGPSEESREVGEAKKDRAERYQIRRRFWTQLLDRARKQTKLHATVSAPEYGWVGTGAGERGLGFNYVITKHGATAELYIDRGDAEENQSVFDALHGHKEEIDAAYGGPLSWEPLDGKRGCRIAERMALGGYRDPEERGRRFRTP